MKPENQKVFEDCKQYGRMVQAGGAPLGISHQQRMNLEKAIREEFQPGYLANHSCEACIIAMISLAYFYYDQYEARK